MLMYVLSLFSVYREGIRKSRRERFAPLEYWRGEKVVYGRTESSGPILVPTIKEIRRIPSEPPVPLGINKKKRKYKKNSTNPEQGWDDDTLPNGEVYDMERHCVVERRESTFSSVLPFLPPMD
jgi:centromere protein C